MREENIEQYLVKKVEDLGGKAYKFNSGIRGVPDRIVLLPGGIFSFVEVKAPGEKPRPIQKKRMREIQRLGTPIAVVDSYESVLRFLNALIGVNMPYV